MTSDFPESDLPVVALARLLREATGVCAAVVGDDERLVRVNPALTKACGLELTGTPLATVLLPASLESLRTHVAAGAAGGLLLQFVPPHASPFSLRAFVEPREAGFAFSGELPWDDHRVLEAHLQSLNAELAGLSREHARKSRQLQQALTELRDSHWHLDKIAEVLPVCVECRAVQTKPGTWEDVSDFLLRSADFLSHGYCARCAAALSETLGPRDGAT